MVVTKVVVRKYESGSLKGFATVTLDDELVLTGLKIVNGKKGLFVAMPSEAGADDKYYDIYYPVNQDLRNKIEDAVLDEYEKPEAEEKPKRSRR